MENGQKSLKDLFDGRKIFRIPDYQRAYAWDASKQLPDFIEDIDNQRLGRDYFLGTILLRETSQKIQGFDVIDIVDGQQRITTIIIFMKVLLDMLEEELGMDAFVDQGLDLVRETYINSKGRPKLQAISQDNEFFQSYILGSQTGDDFIQAPSQRRLLQAMRFFSKQLVRRSSERLLELKRKIDEHTRVLTYSVTDAAEATLIFETTNDRGKGLTNLEKIKSFLMYKTYLAAGDTTEQRLASIQQRFADIFRELELFDGKLAEDSILQYHCIAFEAWKDKEDYQHPVEFVRGVLNPLINKGENTQALEFIERFSRELKETFRIVRTVLACELPAFRDLICLERPGPFYPLLLKSFKLDQTADKRQFGAVAKMLEIYCFRVFAVQQNRSNSGQTKLYGLARDFKGRYEKLCDQLAALVNDFSTRKELHSALTNSDLYNKMDARDLTYLIWKYENHLRQEEQPVCSAMSEDELRSDDRKTRLTVEHIAPQTPNAIVEDASILPLVDQFFAETHLHRLGNLTFDPTSANSSKGNKSIAIKQSKYFSKAPFKTQNELEDFLDRAKWTSASIEQRESKIVDFALKHWSPQYVSY